MSISVGDNFSYLGAKPMDGRLKYDTLADMVGMADATLYDGCMAYCVATDKNYQWKSTNTTDATLGKWREVEGVAIATASTAGKVKPDDTTIKITSDGTISVVDMVGATASTAGAKGLIPSPSAGDNEKFLKGDGTWSELNTLGFTPVGTIIVVMGTTAPQNYLACDGTAYNIADYPVLSAYIEEQFGTVNHFGGDGTTTFAVPDLRGEFLRGTGTNGHSGNGDGASVGVHQDASEIPSCFSYNNNTLYNSSSGVSGSVYRNIDTKRSTSSRAIAEGTKQTTSGEMISLRPTNTSVLYCIATKNIYVDARFDYSTTEKVVGTWIDGKPLYQKTINYDLSAVAKPSTTRGWQYIDILPSDIDFCTIDYGMSFINASGNASDMALINFVSASDAYCQFRVYDKKIQLLTEGTNFYYAGCGTAGAYILFTIQYTKTTD